MQPYNLFFPNYPPPPIPTRESIINEGLKILQQSKTDQEWLKPWIERKKEQKQLSSNRITLSDYRQKLIQHAHLLQQYDNALKNFNHKILFELKIQIEQSNNFIYDCNIIKNIQKQIYQRKLKRARLRRQKEKKLIPNKNNIIEEKLINEKSFIEKIQDIKSILQTIEKLKYIRQKRQQDNINIITTTNNTDDELIEIENICTTKLDEYKIEIKKQSQSSDIELYNYLFNNNNQSFYESTNSDAQDFLQAHQNINNLIKIRQTWDQYSTTHITSLDNIIPSQWHEPQIPCDSNWTRYIFNKKE
ncbi:unnamed protein product [Rotaria sordida]|uniref:Uncharacterized protein n=1 Tax=Rotaria sordida TaxID=392033 RepID=A0A815EMF1_9BILA|nr:unnamed protein product [Rotaria sordida]CAF3685597.1 unnamed protein product [Rotaria sordida]